MGNKQNPPVVVALRKILLHFSVDLIVCICGTSPVLCTLMGTLWKYQMDSGLSSVSHSAGQESGPTASQFSVPQLTTPTVGLSPSDTANGLSVVRR